MDFTDEQLGKYDRSMENERIRFANVWRFQYRNWGFTAIKHVGFTTQNGGCKYQIVGISSTNDCVVYVLSQMEWICWG